MASDICRFAEFELDRSAYQLRRKGRPVQLERIPLDVLFILADRRGQLVTREEIIERVWGKKVFLDTDHAINTAVWKIRHALHDDSESPRFVATVPAKGYRFVAPVRAANTARSEPSRVRLPQNSLVGRECEMATLRAGLDDATSGRGRLFLISGEPGIGKTRLADELAVLADAKGMALLVGHCSERDEAVAYLPFVEILENFIDRASTPDALRTALGEQGPELARLLPRLKNILPGLPPPLDLPPAQARRQLFNCYRDFIARVAREQPLLLVLEDLHWSDDSTLSLLDHLMQRLSDLPLLLVGTYRDAGLNVTGGLAKTLEDLLRGRLATQVRLKGLPRDEVAAMLKSLSGKSPPDAVVSEIYAETEGNPFFVEELFRHLEEENRLYDSAGQFRSELESGELEAPPSVRLVVARRLARLTDLTQKMLATAAVIGRLFSFEILHCASAANEDSILKCIEEAEKAGLVFSVADSPKARFQFSHELVRQAVIGGLSAARRQRLHLEVADAIERTYSAALEDYCAELAHHYARGANPGKAVEYCLRAVRQFQRLGSYVEALAHFESGLELLQKLPDDDRRAELELDLRNAAAEALRGAKGLASPEAEQSSARAMELCQRLGVNWEKTWSALFGVYLVQLVRPNTRKACEIASELVARAEEHGSAQHIAEAATWLAFAKVHSGDFDLAAQGFDRAMALLESIAKPATGLTERRAGLISQAQTIQRLRGQANNRIYSAWNLCFLGYPDRALERVSTATAIARESGSKAVLDTAHYFATVISWFRREVQRMRESAEATLVLSAESGNPENRNMPEVLLGWADAMAGDLDGGIARMRHHLSELRATGEEVATPHCFALIATALGRMGRFDEALRTIDESFPIIERTGARFFEAEVHRVKGELLLAQDASNAAQAEQSFRTAIEISRKQHAKSWELRATTSLARLLDHQGKRDEARTMLADIYKWFTEGFDTADLKDAKSLLDELTG